MKGKKRAPNIIEWIMSFVNRDSSDLVNWLNDEFVPFIDCVNKAIKIARRSCDIQCWTMSERTETILWNNHINNNPSFELSFLTFRLMSIFLALCKYINVSFERSGYGLPSDIIRYYYTQTSPWTTVNLNFHHSKMLRQQTIIITYRHCPPHSFASNRSMPKDPLNHSNHMKLIIASIK